VKRLVLAGGLAASVYATLALAAGKKPEAPPAPVAPAAAPEVGPGSLYDRYCLACHGEAGDGAGPAAPFVYPRPRDFTRAMYRWRSTPAGKPPSDDDLARSIREGAPGTSMPGFAGILSGAQIGELVQTVKAFAPHRFARSAAPGAAIVAPAPPRDLAALAARGAELFRQAGCVSCHGPGGKGDGPAAASLKDEKGRAAPPFDLTAEPLRRGAQGAADLFVTIAAGIDGRNMPGFAGALPDADLWALVAHVDGLRFRGSWSPGARALDPRGVEPWTPGLGVAAQGEPPASLPPASASLSALRCARCHARQAADWSGSRHARTAGPGTLGQFIAAKPGFVASCQRCHAPLAEQLPGAPGFDADLQAEGATCAGCHLRGWTRHGPPRADDARLLGDPSYPLVVDAAYERSDFCLPCHQLAPADAVEGRPLLDTYREWLEGPYMRRGVQCQHCHMPERTHSWKGVHDAPTVRQGLAWTTSATRGAGGAIATRVSIRNVGAGHYLPTTTTPAAFVDVALVDASGHVLATKTQRIGRQLVYQGAWKQLADTRIAPGGTLEFAPAFDAALARGATLVRVTLRMHPDDYYETFYTTMLRGQLPAAARPLLEQALASARKSRFVVMTRDLPLP
jgi:mono/diheme cytochrome c family protein